MTGYNLTYKGSENLEVTCVEYCPKRLIITKKRKKVINIPMNKYYGVTLNQDDVSKGLEYIKLLMAYTHYEHC